LLIAVPFHLKGVLLFAIYILGFSTPSFVLALSWCAGSNTGHTKKTTTNAMLLIGYCESAPPRRHSGAKHDERS
jgi:hypothetical protein